MCSVYYMVSMACGFVCVASVLFPVDLVLYFHFLCTCLYTHHTARMCFSGISGVQLSLALVI